MKCILLTNMWEDAGVKFIVHRYTRGINTTGCTLELEHPEGGFVTRTVAYHQIEWIEDED